MAKRHRIRKRARAFAARGARSRKLASLRPGAMRKKGFRRVRSPAQNFRIRWFLAMGSRFRRQADLGEAWAGGIPQRNRRGRGDLGASCCWLDSGVAKRAYDMAFSARQDSKGQETRLCYTISRLKGRIGRSA